MRYLVFVALVAVASNCFGGNCPSGACPSGSCPQNSPAWMGTQIMTSPSYQMASPAIAAPVWGRLMVTRQAIIPRRMWATPTVVDEQVVQPAQPDNENLDVLPPKNTCTQAQAMPRCCTPAESTADLPIPPPPQRAKTPKSEVLDKLPPPPIPDAPKKSEVSIAVISIQVPDDAVVYINGKQTKHTGTVRNYVSRNLADRISYHYDIKVQCTRQGWVYENSKSVDLVVGEKIGLDFAPKEFVCLKPAPQIITRH